MAKTLVAGTFNNIHKGHRALLDKAIEVAGSDRLTVGLTSDTMASTKKHPVRPFNTRAKELEEYLLRNKQLDFSIVEIDGVITSNTDDIIDWEHFECLVVSRESLRGGKEFCEYYKKMFGRELKLVVVPTVYGAGGYRVSSTNICNGRMDLEGNRP